MKDYQQQMRPDDGAKSRAAATSPTRVEVKAEPRLGILDQLPTVFLTAIIVIAAAAWLMNYNAAKQNAELATLRQQNEALKAQIDDGRRQLESTSQFLKDTIKRRDSELFSSDDELRKMNDERMDKLAEAIAQKVVPALPAPKSAAELEQLQADQIDKVATRMIDDLRPMLSRIADEQNAKNAAAAEAARANENHVRQLTKDLQTTQAAAHDALAISRELTARYLDSFKDQGVLVRLLSLPANLVIDTANLHLINNGDRAKTEQQLNAKLNAIEEQLRQIQPVKLADKS